MNDWKELHEKPPINVNQDMLYESTRLKVEEISTQFKESQSGAISIEDFFRPNVVGEIAEEIKNINDASWKYFFRDHINGVNKVKQKPAANSESLFRAKYDNKINNFLKQAHEHNSKGEFSFFCERTDIIADKRVNNRSDVLSELVEFLNSSHCLSFLSSIYGEQLKLLESHVVKYKRGYFSGIKQDNIKGAKLFVSFNLSPHWRYEYGGMFHLLNKTKEKVIETPSVNFNSAILSKFLKSGSIPYIVSPIVNVLEKQKIFYNCYFG